MDKGIGSADLFGVSGGEIGSSLALLLNLAPPTCNWSLASTSAESDRDAARFLDGGPAGVSAMVLMGRFRVDPFPSRVKGAFRVGGLGARFLSGGNVCACLSTFGLLLVGAGGVVI